MSWTMAKGVWWKGLSGSVELNVCAPPAPTDASSTPKSVSIGDSIWFGFYWDVGQAGFHNERTR